MKLRKHERAALVDLLENGAEGVETPDDLADALAKTLDDLRAERITYVALFRFGRETSTFYTAIGPHATRGQAEKAVEKCGFEYTAYAIASCRSVEGHAALIAEVDAGTAPKGDFALVAEDAARFKRGWRGNRKNAKDYE